MDQSSSNLSQKVRTRLAVVPTIESSEINVPTPEKTTIPAKGERLAQAKNAVSQATPLNSVMM